MGRQDTRHRITGGEHGLFVPEDVTGEMAQSFRKHFREIYAYCAYRLFKKDVAEDAVGEVFLRFVEKYPAIRGRSEAGVRRWLFAAAKHVVSEHRRDRRRHAAIAAAMAAENSGTFAGVHHGNGHVRWSRLHTALSRLNPRYRDILFLRYFRELSASEIAQLTGMKQGTVRVVLSRATAKLKKEMEDHAEPHEQP